MADVLRADARETEMLAGSAVCTAAEAAKLATDLIRQRPSQVALAVDGLGNLVAWPEDSVFLPLTDTPVVDTTGAGDAFVAALITALAQAATRSVPHGSRSPRPAPPSATPAAGLP